MRNCKLILFGCLTIGSCSPLFGQCMRGGGGRSAGGVSSPIATTAGFNSSQGLFSPIGSSPAASYQAIQYQYQIAQLRYELWRQQREMEMLAEQQRRLMNAAQQNDDDLQPASDDQQESRNSARDARILKNAERIMTAARKAETASRSSDAVKSYRKVVKLLDEDAPLAVEAQERLDRLAGVELASLDR